MLFMLTGEGRLACARVGTCFISNQGIVHLENEKKVIPS